jgi:hypothetical protein
LADFILGTGVTDGQRRAPTLLAEFGSTELAKVQFRALAGTSDSAKLARRRCCAICNSKQREASGCIKFFPFQVYFNRKLARGR